MRLLSSARALWFFLAVAAAVGGAATMPGADPATFLLGVPEVSASANPNPLWLSERGTPPLASVKATAANGTAAGPGPSANVGQTIQLKGGALAPGVAVFAGYNGTPVTSTLTSVKVGKKGKATVPALAVTGGVAVQPDGGEVSASLPLQIVPTITTVSAATVSAGTDITIDGTGFAPDLRVVFPGVATPVAPSSFDNDSAVVTVPDGVQKGKLKVTTSGGSSNTKKLKVATKSLANHALATDPETGLVIATDDVENTLSAIDPATGQVMRSVRIPADAEWITVLEGTRIAVVGNDSGAIAWIDLASWAPYNPGLTGKDFNARSDELYVDPSSGGIVGPAGAWSLTISPYVEFAKVTPDGHRAVAVAGDTGTIYVIDLATRSVVATHRFDGPVEGITIGLDGRAFTIDRATGQLLSVPID